MYVGYRDSMDDKVVKTEKGAIGKFIGLLISETPVDSSLLTMPETYDTWQQ